MLISTPLNVRQVVARSTKILSLDATNWPPDKSTECATADSSGDWLETTWKWRSDFVSIDFSVVSLGMELQLKPLYGHDACNGKLRSFTSSRRLGEGHSWVWSDIFLDCSPHAETNETTKELVYHLRKLWKEASNRSLLIRTSNIERRLYN